MRKQGVACSPGFCNKFKARTQVIVARSLKHLRTRDADVADLNLATFIGIFGCKVWISSGSFAWFLD